MKDIITKKRGRFYTPQEIFNRYIYGPFLSDLKLSDYIIVDFFCGTGDLLIPLIERFDNIGERNKIFRENIFGFDIDGYALSIFKGRLLQMGIKEKYINENIIKKDTLKELPLDRLHGKKIIHITNPPYLYKGYYVKQKETRELNGYFDNLDIPLQDLYQKALYNDVMGNLEMMIYIIPSNYLFGEVSAGAIRDAVFNRYSTDRIFWFTKQIFDETDINTIILRLKRKKTAVREIQDIKLIECNGREKESKIKLNPSNHYRAGFEWDEWLQKKKAKNHPDFEYYLKTEDLKNNKGKNEVCVYDFSISKCKKYSVNNEVCRKIRKNHLIIRTLDTGSNNGRIGIYEHSKIYGTAGLTTSKGCFRTTPIQILFYRELSYTDQIFIMKWCNYWLEYFRGKLNSIFLTTYRHTSKNYTRKIIGLKKVKELIFTCPVLSCGAEKKQAILRSIEAKSHAELLNIIEERDSDGDLSFRIPEKEVNRIKYSAYQYA
ncbi:SAM-dependent DNA methyltransferase [Candidatus Saganbacteria bacterium]|nr:SAM-dependent DNA methyltransferase [Candidatus Saganbacteria bacterium]